MCRNIKTLFNFEPVATDEEINAAALQFVRKVSGFKNPSKVNQEAFELAVEKIGRDCRELLNSLETTAEPKNREVENARAMVRSKKRFGIKDLN
jgi:hypothetical protein